MHRDMGQANRIDGNPGSFECLANFRTRDATSVVARAFDYGSRASQRLRIQLKTTVVRRHPRMDPRRGERQHPAQVSGGDEMPRRPQDMGSQNRAAGDLLLDVRRTWPTGQPLPQTPTCVLVLLRLNRAEPGDQLGSRADEGRGEKLIAEAGGDDQGDFRLLRVKVTEPAPESIG